MANYNAEVEAFMSVHNETPVKSAQHVAPPSKECEQLILQQLVKKINEESARAQETSSYGITR